MATHESLALGTARRAFEGRDAGVPAAPGASPLAFLVRISLSARVRRSYPCFTTAAGRDAWKSVQRQKVVDPQDAEPCSFGHPIEHTAELGIAITDDEFGAVADRDQLPEHRSMTGRTCRDG